MSISIRRGTAADLTQVQQCNLQCLPENYGFRYYAYHLLSWPHLLYVAVDTSRVPERVVGYVLAKMNDEEDDPDIHGHITSLAVLRSHRKLGIATKLMLRTQADMETVHHAEYSSLHVRESNTAAFHLYNVTLGYLTHDIERKYYADGEDAYDMRKPLKYYKGAAAYSKKGRGKKLESGDALPSLEDESEKKKSMDGEGDGEGEEEDGGGDGGQDGAENEQQQQQQGEEKKAKRRRRKKK